MPAFRPISAKRHLLSNPAAELPGERRAGPGRGRADPPPPRRRSRVPPPGLRRRLEASLGSRGCNPLGRESDAAPVPASGWVFFF